MSSKGDYARLNVEEHDAVAVVHEEESGAWTDAVPVARPVMTAATVPVAAPADLPAGYEFTVQAQGTTVRVVVPSGGVSKGDHFDAMIVPTAPPEAAHEVYLGGFPPQAAESNPHRIPHGQWRDGLCSCTAHGCCHPSCCVPLWCAPVALGQLLSRINLDHTGSPSNRGARRRSAPFQLFLVIFLVSLVVNWYLSSLVGPYLPQGIDIPAETADIPKWVHRILALKHCFNSILFLFILIVMVRARIYIRQLYQIPETCCAQSGGVEDVLCGFFCYFCTLSQMLRHTADYETYSGSYCTSTGLPSRAPEVV